MGNGISAQSPYALSCAVSHGVADWYIRTAVIIRWRPSDGNTRMDMVSKLIFDNDFEMRWQSSSDWSILTITVRDSDVCCCTRSSCGSKVNGEDCSCYCSSYSVCPGCLTEFRGVLSDS